MLRLLLLGAVLAGAAEPERASPLSRLPSLSDFAELLPSSSPQGPAGAPARAPEYRAGQAYKVRVDIDDRSGGGEERHAGLREDVQAACGAVHRALYVLENHAEAAIDRMGRLGAVSRHLQEARNREFYVQRLRGRYAACAGGTVPLRLVGRCGTEQGTLAYVRTPFGVPLRTIHVCDEYFDQGAQARRRTLVHEFGRLEGIGDAESPSNDSIYTWDRVVDELMGGQDVYDAVTAPPPAAGR